MGFFDRFKNKVQTQPEEANVKNAIKIPTQLYRINMDLNRYRNAVQSAENIYNPQRLQLYQVYQQAMLDPHLNAVWMQIKNAILGCEFNFYTKDGKEDEEKSKIFKQKWFYDYLSDALDAKLWGHSLIQFGNVVNLGECEGFNEAYLIPRQYVSPEFSKVSNTNEWQSGINFLDEPYFNWCIGVGEKRDLGLLLQLTPLFIWKKNAMGAWAEFIEKFGSPIRIGKTDSTDEKSVNQMQGMLENMGFAAWGLFKTDDIIELHESKHSDAFQVFNEMIERCNSEMSKLLIGQTMTVDNGSSRSQSEVHERVLESFIQSYKRFIYMVNNNQLKPMMNRLGFGLDGHIDIEQEDELSLIEKGAFDIELLKTGKFTFTPEYIKEKYDTEVIPVVEPVDNTDIQNKLNELYS